MKTRPVLIILLAWLILTQSCTVRIPMTNSNKEVHNGGTSVTPYYNVKKRKASTFGYILPFAAFTTGGLVYAYAKPKDKLPASLSIFTLGGYFFWYVYLSKKLVANSKEQVTPQNFDKWLSDYNRKQNQNYVKAGQDSYGYLLVPKNQLSAYNAEEKRLKEEAERQRVLAEQRRKEQEERDRIARIEREEQERKERIEREAREKRERETKERAEREYAEKVARNPELLEWQPMVQWNVDYLFPSYILSYSNELRVAAITKDCDEASFKGSCASVLGIAIKNPAANTKIYVEILDTEEQYIRPIREYFTLEEANKVYTVFPKVGWKNNALLNRDRASAINFVYKIGIGENKIEKQKSIKLMSIYDCPLDINGKDKSFLFTAYVNENDSNIEVITKEAIDMGLVSEFSGYQGQTESEIYLSVEKQVQGIWTVLQNRGIKYSSLTGSSVGKNINYQIDKVFYQYVRPLSLSLASRQANCIDGAVAMASILKKIGIDPLIVLLEGHAFVGYCTRKAKRDAEGNFVNWRERNPVFIETTKLGSEDVDRFPDIESKKRMARLTFKEAREIGDNEFIKDVLPNLDKSKYWVIDVSKFGILIDPIGK